MDEPAPDAPPPAPQPAPQPGVFARTGSDGEAEAALQFTRTLHALTPQVWVTWILLAANVVVFGIMVASGVDPLTPKITDLLRWGANFTPLTTGGEWWRLETSTFLHIGVLHIAMNMFVLVQIGRFVERLVGSASFLGAYLFAGLAGSLASTIANPHVVSAGASGAIFGLYGTLLGFVARDRASIPKPVLKVAVRTAVIFVGYNLLYAASQKGIDQSAHLGGLAGGFLCGLVLAHPITPAAAAGRPKRALLVAVMTAALLALGVFALPHRTDTRAEVVATLLPEHNLLARFNTAVEDAHNHKLGDPAFADLIEKEVLPGWRAMEIEAHKLSAKDAAGRKMIDVLQRYLAARRQAFEALVQAARTEDPTQIQRAKDQQHEAAQVLLEFKQLSE